MTDHKFTDDEIIHSLKVCSNDGDCSECLINPHKGNYGYCTSLAIKAALDLINRQKAEIEGLQGELAVYRQQLETIPYTMEQIAEVAKIEAIKEFAWRLKSRLTPYPEAPFCEMVGSLDIDALVEEMTEEKENESKNT